VIGRVRRHREEEVGGDRHALRRAGRSGPAGHARRTARETRRGRGRDALAGLLAAGLLASASLASAAGPASAGRVLRICADPNNLPFSNARREGFENRIAERVARELGAAAAYAWWPQRRGFVRNTLAAGACDLVPGVPAGFELTLNTRPYYRSTYVAVSRAADRLGLTWFDDPRLHRLRIGVQLIGDDYANAPPAHALARRGIVDNVTGYTVYGDYAEDSPPARIVAAVARGEVDVAFVWGPLAGYFAPRATVPLDVRPLAADADPPALRFAFDIAMGVRKGDRALRDEVDRALERLRPEIEATLDAYGVVRVPRAGLRAAAERAP
jgi:quinoprotein dehydrogenase-associated probable ABC transporter substrate-binding protein